jgi:hypothetical protein
MAARSVPECGAAGAQGWNIDYLAPTWCLSLVQAGSSPRGGLWILLGGCGCGMWGVVGRCLTRCWVLKDRATRAGPGFAPGSAGVCGLVSSGWWALPRSRLCRGGCGVPVVF